MIQQLVLRELDRLAARYRYLRMWQVLSAVWLIAAVAGVTLWAWKIRLATSGNLPVAALGVCALLIAGVVILVMSNSSRSYPWLARQVEKAFPELHTCLLAAIEQKPDLPHGEFGFLQASVIKDALSHARKHHWTDIVSQRQLILAGATNLLAFLLFSGALLAALTPSTGKSGSPFTAPATIAAVPKFEMTVEPGNVEVERGSSLLVLARIQGPMPAEATLVYQPNNKEEITLAMPPSLKDPVFGARVAVVEEPLEYQVKTEKAVSPRFQVKVFEYPRLERADAQLVYPSYTGLAQRTIQDVRTVSVVEGTQLTLQCYLNKPVKTAQLVNAKPNPMQPDIPLVASAANPLLYEAKIACVQSRRLQLQLVDDAGRKAQKVEQFTINVQPNQPPTIKPIFPARDLEVSALEELDVKASVQDDFGVRRFGLEYAIAGQEPREVVLVENAAPKQKHEIAQQIKLEEMKAEPDQLLSYHWWVEDFDAQGNIRRTQSDMYFAEIRPFEEIFRQGEQPPGGSEAEQQRQRQQQQQQQQQGQGQNAQQAQELAKLQKDIINATWKVMRRETTTPPTAMFVPDVEQLGTSQASALEQASGLGDRVEDEQSQSHVEEVLKHMQTAIDQLKSAQDTTTAAPLTPALKSEQAAYQALLKLRAREHEVVRQQRQQQQQQQNQQQQQQQQARSQQQQQQLQQLDLREEQNRYETQRAAQEQQRQQDTAEERENRQVLNRLRELAQRQHDLNDRLKELQSALEAAQTPMEKEDIRRQLQRLQDEERQILQDTDELQARLDQPENQQKMEEQRQQLDETRDQVRRASEALQQERVSQAAAAGTRAEQQFDDLREEFRRRASNGFQEDVRQMRQAARDIEQKEQELSQAIRGEQETKPQKTDTPNLREEDRREQVTEQVTKQRERLTNLQEQMRDTIERAEATEPILSQRLYDTARNLRDQNIDRALQSAERSARQGLTEQAQTQEAAAGEGIKQLREGIEKAAEGVLGDETESLRRAREELRNLSRELEDEVRRNAPMQLGEQRPMGENREGQQPGERGERGQQPGERGQQGQGQRGERGQQPGERGQQPGERGQRGEGGQQPGEQQGEQPGERGQRGQGQRGEGQQPGQGQRGQQPGERGQQPGERGQGGQQPGENPQGEGERGQRGEGQPGGQRGGQGRGQRGERGEQPPGQEQPMPNDNQNPPGEEQPMGERGQPGEGGQQPGQGQGRGQRGQQPGERGQQPGERGQRGQRSGGTPNLRGGTGAFEDYVPTDTAPLTGENFREWSDRLRDVEEMVDDPALRADAARIRERARAMRVELKRHSATPNWDLVQDQISKPLAELQDRVAEELLKRTSKKAIVPLDRDPVPPQFSEKTRRYYERLGSGK